MKKTILWSSIALFAIALGAQFWWPVSENHLREGDIVFRGTGVGVAALTLSKWTHCGILVKENGQWLVYEAIGSVKKTPLKAWKRHDVPYICRVMRPKEPLTETQTQQIRLYLNSLKGCKYDNAYSWSDDLMYCSELVWKAYHVVGMDLSTPRPINTFMLFKILPNRALDFVVQKKDLSLSEPMVPPCDLINSKQLKRVW